MGAGLGKTQIPYGGIIHIHRQKRKYPRYCPLSRFGVG